VLFNGFIRQKVLIIQHIQRRFVFHDEAFPDIPEIHPVQGKVDNNQRRKRKTCHIMHVKPLTSWDVQEQ